MKIVSAALFIVAIIALIGSIGAVLTLLATGSIADMAVPPDVESQFDADLIQETRQQIATFMTIVWIWVITVFVTSLTMLYITANDLIAKKRR